jgi:hypothetical protein
VQSLSFPLRLRENGLLQRSDASASLIALLQTMARTPQGSWQACPSFGLRDLFEDRMRADLPRLAQQRITQTLEDLGMAQYTVHEVVREISNDRGTDVYAITLQDGTNSTQFSAQVATER